MIPQNDSFLEDLLSAQADALLAGQPFDVPADADNMDDLMPLFTLAQSLSGVLVPALPSEAFSERLKGELVGEPSMTLLTRWRKLPPHYRAIARLGGLTITAGLTLLAIRRGFNLLSKHQQPETDKGLPLTVTS
jgi:hypothetical protein